MDALIVLASLSHSASRKVSELGFAIGILGALAIAAGGLPRPRGRIALIGGLALAAGLVLVIVAIHWGVSPYRTR
jgi:hypothetical protein